MGNIVLYQKTQWRVEKWGETMVATVDVQETVDFKQGDMNENFRRFILWLRSLPGDHPEGESDEALVRRHISGYLIEDAGHHQLDITVQQGKLKSAVFLYWLSVQKGAKVFEVGPDDHPVVKSFFFASDVEDALNNPLTVHTTIRALLANGPVTVTVRS